SMKRPRGGSFFSTCCAVQAVNRTRPARTKPTSAALAPTIQGIIVSLLVRANPSMSRASGVRRGPHIWHPDGPECAAFDFRGHENPTTKAAFAGIRTRRLTRAALEFQHVAATSAARSPQRPSPPIPRKEGVNGQGAARWLYLTKPQCSVREPRPTEARP